MSSTPDPTAPVNEPDKEDDVTELEKTINDCIKKSLNKAITTALAQFKNDMRKLIDDSLADFVKHKAEVKKLKDDHNTLKKRNRHFKAGKPRTTSGREHCTG